MESILPKGIALRSTSGLMLTWYDVRDALLRQVEKQRDRITLRMGAHVHKIVDNDNDNYVKVQYRSAHSDEHGEELEESCVVAYW